MLDAIKGIMSTALKDNEFMKSIMLFLLEYLSEEDTAWNPIRKKGLEDLIFCLKIRKTDAQSIIEAKKSDKESDMDKECKEAIKQIVKEKYAQGLKGYEEIIGYGAAFFQKQVKLKLK